MKKVLYLHGLESNQGGPKVDSNDQFRIVKINSKNVVVEKINVNGIAGTIRVSPSLLIKIEK